VEKIVVSCSLLAFVSMGAVLFQDYGVSFDEISHLEGAEHNYKLVSDGTPLPTDRDWYHYGPFFDLSVHLLSRLLSFDDIRTRLLFKHLVTFLFYCSALVCFYLLCRKYFDNWIWAYLACVLMIIHPRIFAESFYNPKDLPFMSAAIISGFTMFKFTEKPRIAIGILHGLATAICIDIRIIGVFFVALTFAIIVADELRKVHNIGKSKRITSYCGFIVSLFVFTILLWPHLWASPINRFMDTLAVMARFPWPEKVLYFGQMIPATDTPLHYLPTWILITTPLSISVFFVIGWLGFPTMLNRWRKTGASAAVFLPYLWFGIPFVAAVIMKPTMYDGWRQFYFLYPPLVILAVQGLMWFWEMAAAINRRYLALAARTGMILFIAADLGASAGFIIRSHPHQNVYFNGLVAGVRGAEGVFELDYWGLSYRKMLEEVLIRNKGSRSIPIAGSELPVELNTYILPKAQRERLVYYLSPDKIPRGTEYYFLSTFRGLSREWLLKYPPVFTVSVDGAVIGAAFQIKAE
jgi:hypothetical protein